MSKLPTTRVVFVLLTSSLSLVAMVTLDIANLQSQFWALCAVALLGGDTVTTALLGRYGLEEGPGFTRWACGTTPTLRCAFVTRLAIFGTLVVMYRGLTTGPWPLQTGSAVIPVVFGIAGVVATCLNTVGILRAARVGTESQ